MQNHKCLELHVVAGEGIARTPASNFEIASLTLPKPCGQVLISSAFEVCALVRTKASMDVR